MIYISSDHAGFKLKESLKKYLLKLGVDFLDLGPENFNPQDDYPVFAKNLAKKVSENPENRGIMICGTGLGSCIAANKIKGIRAVSAWNKKTAEQSRLHLDSNVLCLGQKVQPLIPVKKIVKTWLETEFSKEERHVRRIAMIK